MPPLIQLVGKMNMISQYLCLGGLTESWVLMGFNDIESALRVGAIICVGWPSGCLGATQIEMQTWVINESMGKAASWGCCVGIIILIECLIYWFFCTGSWHKTSTQEADLLGQAQEGPRRPCIKLPRLWRLLLKRGLDSPQPAVSNQPPGSALSRRPDLVWPHGKAELLATAIQTEALFIQNFTNMWKIGIGSRVPMPGKATREWLLPEEADVSQEQAGGSTPGVSISDDSAEVAGYKSSVESWESRSPVREHTPNYCAAHYLIYSRFAVSC